MKRILMTAITIALPLLFGCNGMDQSQARVDANWGRSYETARFSQLVNPDAGMEEITEPGLDGVAANYNYDKYRKMFEKEVDQPQTLTINLGK